MLTLCFISDGTPDNTLPNVCSCNWQLVQVSIYAYLEAKSVHAKLGYMLLASAALAIAIIVILYESRPASCQTGAVIGSSMSTAGCPPPPRGCTAQAMPGEYAASDALASKVIPGCAPP